MSIKTRKIKLIPAGETAKDRTNTYKYVKNIAENLAEVGNKIIRLHVNNLYDLDELIKDHNMTKKDAVETLTKKFGTSLQNAGYRLTTSYTNIASEIRTGFNQSIYKTLSNNFYDIKTGKQSLPSFRKTNINIPFSARKNENGGTNTIYIENDIYSVNLPLTLSERKIVGEIKLNLLFGKDRSNNKIIVNRLISGEYQMSDSSIQVKDNELYLLLTYKQPDTQLNTQENINVMGVDIGINRPVSFYISNINHQPKQISIGEKIQHERIKFAKQRRSIQENLKYSKGGHGSKRKLQKLNDLREKEKNWSIEINHKISRELINIAQDNNVGLIKLEDLTGITTNSKDYFLKSWAYYQLQTFIEYKANEVGINIEWVDPKHTSTTCPTCNQSDPDNRDTKDKTKFACTNLLCDDFGKVKDADVVAAKNICFKESTSVKMNSKEGKILKKKQLTEQLQTTE
jgi:IS605 OrfB family transposase